MINVKPLEQLSESKFVFNWNDYNAILKQDSLVGRRWGYQWHDNHVKSVLIDFGRDIPDFILPYIDGKYSPDKEDEWI